MKTLRIVGLFLCLLGSQFAQNLHAQDVKSIANFDRVSTQKTGWYWLTGVSPSTITSKINEGFRLHDLEVESTSPLRFSAVLVKNTGVYKSGFWWWYGQSEVQVKQHIRSKKGRIIDLEVYFVNGQKKYAIVMLPNSGSKAKSWWYYSQITAANLKTKLSENSARLIDLDRYTKGGRTYFSAVMVANKGVDKKAWWYYYGLTASQVKTKLNQNNARLTDIEFDGSKFTVVMERTPGKWYYYYGISMKRVNEITKEKGVRVADIQPYTQSGKKRFAAVFVGN